MVRSHGRAGGNEGTESADAIRAGRTQFDTNKVAGQFGEFSIDPSDGLTRERYAWFSNGAWFDKALFAEPGGVTNSTETKIVASTDSTSYTPTISNFRGSTRASAGQNNELDPTEDIATDELPLGATRVVTASARDGSGSFDVQELEFEVEEGY